MGVDHKVLSLQEDLAEVSQDIRRPALFCVAITFLSSPVKHALMQCIIYTFIKTVVSS